MLGGFFLSFDIDACCCVCSWVLISDACCCVCSWLESLVPVHLRISFTLWLILPTFDCVAQQGDRSCMQAFVGMEEKEGATQTGRQQIGLTQQQEAALLHTCGCCQHQKIRFWVKACLDVCPVSVGGCINQSSGVLKHAAGTLQLSHQFRSDPFDSCARTTHCHARRF